MYKIKFLDDFYIETIREKDPCDEWDADDTCEYHHIRGFKIIDKDKYSNYSNLSVEYEINPEKSYYLLYVIYDTGDSFHREEGKICFINLYENKEIAEMCAKIIYDNYKDWQERDNIDDKYNVTIFSNSGEKNFTFFCPWKVYFESLSNVEITSIRVIE